jgi:hypothetical protein
MPGVASIEERLRWAAAHDALAALRHQLRCRSIVYKYKSRQVVSQREFARSRELEKAVDVRIISCRLQYCATRTALLALKGPGQWEEILQELRAEDVRGLNERVLTSEEHEQHRQSRILAGLPADPTEDENLDSIPTAEVSRSLELGEGRRTLSWIWYSLTEGELDEQGVHESRFTFCWPPLLMFAGLRVEWLKCRARAHRAREEVRLVEEEMRRSLAFCEWKESWWRKQVSNRSVSCLWLAEGIRAYALRQSALERSRHTTWTTKWEGVRVRAAVMLASITSNQVVDGLPNMVIELPNEEDYENADDV